MTASLTSDVDIHPELERTQLVQLVRPTRPLWTSFELRELTSKVAAELTDSLLQVLRFVSPHRWWARLALTEGVELWLLSWLPGQRTAPHDHGGAAGAFTVLLGELAETYRYPAGPIRSQLHTAGSSVGFGHGRAHQVQNLGPGRVASVHAYSPPLVPTREYASLRDIPTRIPPLPPRRGMDELRQEPVEP